MSEFTIRPFGTRKEREILSIAINSRDLQLASDYTRPDIITPQHIELAKEVINEANGKPSSVIWAERLIYKKLLDNADTKVLQVVLDRVEKASRQVDGLAHEVYNEIEQRKLSDAIKVGDVEKVKSYTASTAINPVINYEHLKLAEEKHKHEMGTNRKFTETSDNAVQIFKALIGAARTSVLQEAACCDSSELGFLSQKLIKDELVIRENKRGRHVLDKVMSDKRGR